MANDPAKDHLVALVKAIETGGEVTPGFATFGKELRTSRDFIRSNPELDDYEAFEFLMILVTSLMSGDYRRYTSALSIAKKFLEE